ncbi:Uncharacterised protein [Corynebacterium kutscheri]|uniref:Uncharacterized protein n=1 Tax=Corynebacterium kutscheri TaxID=35755 RepID=A0A0F6QZ54_9CORY|nr:hypothetical protein [Corynebacterium kutscheri]AKE40942.1 hypothetical protein UL82_03675 [Corynebacterium kutscheri]VEH06773.1 Uncharacterised protein [Corynebacterium kutscheri]VEH09241.1 Uncharacterised protein [Corynebacterium kutscheri]VEH79328.1 Uncharacterised protein [Corynebacterium kutscheri]
MRVADATLRHRELTQEVFNIGDEVATYIENLAEAIADWDGELVEDCLAEFTEIIDDARRDARIVITELIGLRQALTSGIASGTISIGMLTTKTVARPVVIRAEDLRTRFPIQQSPVMVGELTMALESRTELMGEYLSHIVEWVLADTERAAREIGTLSLPVLFSRVSEAVTSAAYAWLEAVAWEHPAFARTMRGNNPPSFLNERVRIDAIVARVITKRKQHATDAS